MFARRFCQVKMFKRMYELKPELGIILASSGKQFSSLYDLANHTAPVHSPSLTLWTTGL